MHTRVDSISKALFIVHLAIGDYTYMQRCFEKLKKNYPKLQIDLFIQDHRRTDDESKWPILENYILYEWLESSHLFGKIYKTYSPNLLESSISEAKKENYPLVITLGDLRSQNYSALAREIAQKNRAIGININTTIFHQKHKKDLKKLDARIHDLSDKSQHISQKFAYWFEQIARLEFSQQDLYPQIIIPEKWQSQIDEQLKEWKNKAPSAPSIFINIYAKGEERCWGTEQASKLIQTLQQQEKYQNALFILNSPPETANELDNIIKTQELHNTITFCAHASFFELPALLKRMDLVITVDTSIMHLSCISEAYLISLIRKKAKTDVRWTPLKSKKSTIIYTKNSSDSIKSITTNEILETINTTQTL